MKKINPFVIFCPLLIVLSVVLIFVMTNDENNAIPAMLLNVSFQGEYKTGSEDWKPIPDDNNLAFTDGEIRLRGFFQLEMVDGTVIGKVEKGANLIAHFDHIGGSFIVNGESVHDFDMENSLHGNRSCGESWIAFDCPAEETDTLEIVLRNPHKYGNSDAVNIFLNSMYIYNSAAFDEPMLRQGAIPRMVGITIMVFSFIMLGVAIFSSILNVPYSRILWIFGFMILFAGIFCVIDSPNFSICGKNIVFNNTVKQLCIILYPMFLLSLAQTCLKEKTAKAGGAVTAIYGVLSMAEIIIAMTGNQLLYNLNYYMFMVQLAASLIMIVFCALNFKDSNASLNVMTAVCIGSLLALLTDDFAVLFGVWDAPVVSKAAFAVVFICALLYSLRIIPLNIKASIRAKELQMELQDNKVAVMLSQIQPHFLYNALSAICDLCGTEPIKARDALVDFSVYLRENMDSISSSEPVAFRRELSHIKTYMKLEKMRFGDKVNVVYDIQAEDFEIQPLTIQPLMENAVKHGVCMKEKGGTVTLRTSEENGVITITVIDDGVGFDVNEPTENSSARSHLGLKNVKSRVERFPDGKFSVESEKNKGTVVTISFRK
ncbi:MAG: sensor histidine kinase [Oscillospiraceae bacterium]